MLQRKEHLCIWSVSPVCALREVLAGILPSAYNACMHALQDFFETRLLSMDTDFRVLSATHQGKLPGIDIAQVRIMAVPCHYCHRLSAQVTRVWLHCWWSGRV